MITTVEFNPNTIQTVSVLGGYSYERMHTALLKTKELFGTRAGAETYRDFANNLVAEMRMEIPLAGAFGTGYPFYLFSPALPDTFSIPEYNRYILGTQAALNQHIVEHDHRGWICPSCQEKNRLPDLKTYCKPCDKVSFRPRDMFKALPDVDVFLIAKTDGQTLEGIEQYLEARELGVSDVHISLAIDQFLSGVQSNDKTKAMLLDVTVMDEASFYEAIEQISMGSRDVSVPVAGYRGGHTWDKHPFDTFYIDMLFSMTPLGGDLPANTVLKQQLTNLGVGVDSILEEVKTTCAGTKIDRMLEDTITYQIIRAATMHRLISN